jgi:hypothetical protein
LPAQLIPQTFEESEKGYPHCTGQRVDKERPVAGVIFSNQHIQSFAEVKSQVRYASVIFNDKLFDIHSYSLGYFIRERENAFYFMLLIEREDFRQRLFDGI